MNSFTVLERSLNRAELRWRGLRVLRHSAMVGSVLCVGLCAVAVAIYGGALSSRNQAFAAWAALGVGGLMAWCVVLIRSLAAVADRGWLAAALERINRRWLDRLNTLLFLERGGKEPRAESFARRIAVQAQAVAAEPEQQSPFSARTSLVWLLVFMVLLIATGSLYTLIHPWNHLLVASHNSAPSGSKPPELALPTNNVEANTLWGEVRIIDPGRDLQVTRMDVVPLQIEAAANQPFSQIDWRSAVNGGEEVPHALPPSTEPRYAVYHPTIFLDELKVRDWDVLTYYAKATTDKQDAFASQVYFLEVRPFREDLASLPGGEAGQAYGGLNELTQLISRQEQVVRQTHQYLQGPPKADEQRIQWPQRLAGTEQDLSGSAQHLCAKLAAQQNEPIGDSLDNLVKAQWSLAEAGNLLRGNSAEQAPTVERRALAELVAARKTFQSAVNDHPEAFQEQTQAEKVPDSSPQLSQMAEFSNEAKAAQDFVQKTLDQQRDLQEKTYSSASSGYPRLGETEKQLQQQLQDFRQQHPKVFQSLDSAADRAGQAMGAAANSLQQTRPEARGATQQATRALEQFSQAVQRRNAEQQLANTYRLKRMLDQQAQTLDQRAKADSGIPDEQVDRTARNARQTFKQLAQAAEQEPTRSAFGQPLRDALNGQKQVELDAKLRQLQQAQDETEKQQSAAVARDKLNAVSRAFSASQPKALQLAQGSDALKPAAQEGMTQGLNELQSLLEHLREGRQVGGSEQSKQKQQALSNLQDGMRSQFGDEPRGQDLLHQLEQVLKREGPPDAGSLENLLAELQRYTQENSVQVAQDQDGPELSHIDPSRLPPAYRGRIQKYFQKLSEQ